MNLEDFFEIVKTEEIEMSEQFGREAPKVKLYL